jgi:hypothetical protein
MCQAMHWKVISLDENFVNKGDTWAWVKIDYSDVDWPPLHPNCRCTLLPVIE